MTDRAPFRPRAFVFVVWLLSMSACGPAPGAGVDATDAGASADAAADGSSFDAAERDTVGADVVLDAGVDVVDAVADADITGDASDAAEPVVALPAPGLATRSTTACLLDIDCSAGLHCLAGGCVAACQQDDGCDEGATCSGEGRCVSSSKALDDGAETPPLTFVDVPSSLTRVQAGSDAVTLQGRVEAVRGELPTAFSYRLSATAGDVDASLARAARLDSSGTFTIDLPLDAATISAAPSQTIDVQVVSEFGTLSTTLAVQEIASGAYAARARVDRFGSLELPMYFELFAEPEGASLTDASAVWIAMPTDRAHLFRPRDGDGPDDLEVRAMTWDALLGRWVATWRHDFPGVAGRFASASTLRTPQRSTRVELAADADGAVFGRFTDRWSGFYDVRTTGGVASPAIVVFEGDFEAERAGAGSLPELAPLVAGESDVDSTALRPPPQLGVDIAIACTPSMLTNGEGAPLTVTVDEQTWSCADEAGGVLAVSIGALETVDVDRVGACGIAIAERALIDETTAGAVAGYLDGTGDVGGRSFAEFVDACASGEGGLCRPSEELVCARDLLAWAYTTPEEEPSNAASMIDAWQRATREMFFGQQLGAFQRDAQLRLEWLQSTDYPDFVRGALSEGTATLGGYIEGLLDNWQAEVLDVQLGLLAGQLDGAGLPLLSRQVTDEDAAAARQQLLLEVSQTWRSAMDALTLGAKRWATALRDVEQRAQASAQVNDRALDLYVMSGVLGSLNQRAGAGFANATFSGGFGELVRAAERLALPFDRQLLARDASVVVSRSLDPTSDNFNLIGGLESAALEAIAEANTEVAAVIAESAARELDEATLRASLSDQINGVRDQLIDLCGMPDGCSLEDIDMGAPGCSLLVGPAQCGFAFVDGEVVGPNPSQAGIALQQVLEKESNVTRAVADLEARQAEAARVANRAAEVAAQIDAWYATRLQTIRDIETLIQTHEASYSAAMASIAEDVKTITARRETLAASAREDAAAWESLESDGRRSDIRRLNSASGLRGAAEALDLGIDELRSFLIDRAEDLPSMVGPTTDAGYVAARSAIVNSTTKARFSLRALQAGQTIGARVLESQVERARTQREIQLNDLRAEDLADDQRIINQLRNLEDQAQRDLSAEQIRQFGFDRLIEAARRGAAASLAYERDLIDLNARRDRAWGLVLDTGTLTTRILSAGLAQTQATLAWARLAQQSESLAARHENLKQQRDEINRMLGSPSVVFSWANRLAGAEAALGAAREALHDWLVALEYAAVRPFVDLRIQLLLAQNPAQLEDIAYQLRRLTTECGGTTSYAAVEVRLSEAMGFTSDQVDPVSGEVVARDALFRAALARGDVPVGRRVRLGSTLFGADLWSLDEVWSGGLLVDVNQFPNLATSCNARLYAVDIALEGDIGADVRPTVQLVHSGSSRLRSCQPDLADYLGAVGPESTSFAEITTFETPPRAIAPVAELGEFARPPALQSGDANLTLGGLPFAGQYAVVINRSVGENSDVRWNRLTDVVVRFTFSYQDFFTTSECR